MFVTNFGYYKKSDTSFDTQCIKTSVRLWSECRDLNPRPLEPEPSAIPNFATPRYANLLYEIPGKKSTRKTQFFPHLHLHFRRPPCIGIEPARKGGLTHGGERDKEEAGEPLSGGEAAAAAAAPLPGPVRGGVFGPGDGPGAGDGAFPAGGPAGPGGHGCPRGLCPDGCVVLPGRAGGGDVSGLVGGCDALG